MFGGDFVGILGIGVIPTDVLKSGLDRQFVDDALESESVLPKKTLAQTQ